MRLRKAAKALAEKMDKVHASPSWRGVWGLFDVHGGKYDGPTYEEELKELKAALGESGGDVLVLLREIDEYLSVSHMEKICSGSILHQRIKELL